MAPRADRAVSSLKHDREWRDEQRATLQPETVTVDVPSQEFAALAHPMKYGEES